MSRTQTVRLRLPHIPTRHNHNLAFVLVIVFLSISVFVLGTMIVGGFVKWPTFDFQAQTDVRTDVPKADIPKIDVKVEVQDPVSENIQPEAKTSENAEAITPVETQVPTVNEAVIDTPKDVPTEGVLTIPENFIVEPKLWEKAFVLHGVNGSRMSGTGFSNLAIGTKIYAPMDGYLRKYDLTSSIDGNKSEMITIANREDWSMNSTNRPDDRIIYFNAVDMKFIAFGEVFKGQLIAELISVDLINNSRFNENAVLMVSPDISWHGLIKSPSNNPLDYWIQTLRLLDNQKIAVGE